MTEAGHVWIATEQALNANNTPDGVLGLQLVYANSEKEHIRVSVLYIFNIAGFEMKYLRIYTISSACLMVCHTQW